MSRCAATSIITFWSQHSFNSTRPGFPRWCVQTEREEWQELSHPHDFFMRLKKCNLKSWVLSAQQCCQCSRPTGLNSRIKEERCSSSVEKCCWLTIRSLLVCILPGAFQCVGFATSISDWSEVEGGLWVCAWSILCGVCMFSVSFLSGYGWDSSHSPKDWLKPLICMYYTVGVSIRVNSVCVSTAMGLPGVNFLQH